MDVQREIDQLRVINAENERKIAWLIEHRERLTALPEATVYSDKLDFDRLSHGEIVKVIQVIGGTWDKEASTDSSRIDYVQRVSESEPLRVRCWAGEPPPSCKLVEFEETIPAQVVKRFKLVCKDEEPAPAANTEAMAEPSAP